MSRLTADPRWRDPHNRACDWCGAQAILTTNTRAACEEHADICFFSSFGTGRIRISAEMDLFGNPYVEYREVTPRQKRRER